MRTRKQDREKGSEKKGWSIKVLLQDSAVSRAEPVINIFLFFLPVSSSTVFASPSSFHCSSLTAVEITEKNDKVSHSPHGNSDRILQ